MEQTGYSYLPDTDLPVSPVTLAPWLGRRVYMDLGDGVDGGEFTGTLIELHADWFVVKSNDGPWKQFPSYGSVPHISLADF